MLQTFMIKMCPQVLNTAQYSTVFGRYLQNADSVLWISIWHEECGSMATYSVKTFITFAL